MNRWAIQTHTHTHTADVCPKMLLHLMCSTEVMYVLSTKPTYTHFYMSNAKSERKMEKKCTTFRVEFSKRTHNSHSVPNSIYYVKLLIVWIAMRAIPSKFTGLNMKKKVDGKKNSHTRFRPFCEYFKQVFALLVKRKMTRAKKRE